MRKVLLLSFIILSVTFLLFNCTGTFTLSHAPEITQIKYQGTLLTGEKITIIIEAQDEDNDIISYTITVISPGGSVTSITNSTGIFTNIELKEAGEHTVVALVKDSKNNKASKTDTFNVAEKPVPTCEVTVSSSRVTVGGKVSVWVVGNEPGGTIDKAEIAILKNGVKSYNVCTTNSCAINNFTANEEGEYTVVGTVTDGFGQVATDSATFVAEEIPNATPSCVIVVKPSTNVTVGEQVKGEITGSDPDGVDNIQKTEIALVQDPDNTYRVCNSNFCESKEYIPATVSVFTFIGTVTDIYGAWATCVATFVTHEASQPWIKFDIAKIEPPIRPDRDPTCLIWVNSPVKLVAKSSLGEPIGIESVKFRMYKDSLSGNMEGEVAVDHTNADGEWEGQLTPTHEGTYVFVVNGWQEAQALGDPDASDVITCVATQNAAPVAHVSFNTDELECCGTMTINMRATDDRWIKVATLVVSYVNENGERKENTFTFRTNNDYQTSWCDKYEFHPYVGDVIATLTVSDDYGRTGSASAKSKVIDTYPPKLEFAAVPDGGNARYVTVGGRLVTETSTRVEWCFTASVHRYATASDECSEFRMRYTHCDGCESEFTVRDKLWQYNEGDGDYLNDEGIYFFDMVATQSNGSDYGGIKTSSLHATVIVDTTNPTLTLNSTKVCASNTLYVSYSATDLSLVIGTVTVEGFVSTEITISQNTPLTLWKIPFDGKTDATNVTVSFVAIDKCANTTETSVTVKIDNKFGNVEFGDPIDANRNATMASTELTFSGTFTDLSRVCTVVAYKTYGGKATLTVAYTPDEVCTSTHVSFDATLEVEETDATTVYVTFVASDCCCCEENFSACDCSSETRNSTVATLTIRVDNKFRYASMTVTPETVCDDASITVKGTLTDKSTVVDATITVEGPAELVDQNLTGKLPSQDLTFTATLKPLSADNKVATITLKATDSYGNSTTVVKEITIDSMVGYADFSLPATSNSTEVTFIGTVTDNSSVCNATFTFVGDEISSGGTDVEITSGSVGCESTKVTYRATIDFNNTDRTVATVTLYATDCCGGDCSNTTTVVKEIIVDTMFRYATMDAPDVACTDTTVKATIADNSGIESSNVSCEGPVTCVPTWVPYTSGEVATGVLTLDVDIDDNTDRSLATITLDAMDNFGNATEVVATMIVDNIFWKIEHTDLTDTVTKNATQVRFVATPTDHSSVCTIAYVAERTWTASRSTTNPIITIATYTDFANPCGSTIVTFISTVSAEGEIEGKATITVIATDCCCGNDCGEGCHSSNVTFMATIDTMPPSRTSGPTIATNTSDEATVSMGFHENIATCTGYMATLTYATDTVTHDTTSSTFITDGNNLEIEFSAEDLASVKHATITYKGICDDPYNNERQESDVKVK